MRYTVSRTTHTASNLAVQLIICAVRYVDGYYITSMHVHVYLCLRVPYGLFLENLHPQGRYCCQHPICQFFSVWTKVSPNARAETWWQQSRYLTTTLWRGSVWFWAKPNVRSTYVAIVLPWWRPYDDLGCDNRWCSGSDFDHLMVVMVVVLEHPFRGLWQQWDRTRGRIRQGLRSSKNCGRGPQVLMLDVFTIVPACNLMQCRVFPPVVSTYKTPRANWSQLTVLPCKSEAAIIQWLWKNAGATAWTKEPSWKCVESRPEEWFIGSSTDPMVQEMFGWRRLALCWSLKFPWNISCCLYLRFCANHQATEPWSFSISFFNHDLSCGPSSLQVCFLDFWGIRSVSQGCHEGFAHATLSWAGRENRGPGSWEWGFLPFLADVWDGTMVKHESFNGELSTQNCAIEISSI